MGANLDTGGGDRRSVNVDINIVPFIDLMSCLTAFLLVTAVWINIAQIDIAPRGKSRDVGVEPPDTPMLSVLVSDQRIYVGATRVAGDDATRTIERGGNRTPAQVWAELEDDLKKIKAEYFADRRDIEIAAESQDQHVVPYQDLVSAMDHAIAAGFTDVGLTEPRGLSWRPTL
jgi:biopolymer transport protein ExbD